MRRSGGFSLVELVLVIVILGIIAMYVMPRLDFTAEDPEMVGTELIAAVRYAQELSLTHTNNPNYQVQITVNGFNVTRGGAAVRDPHTQEVGYSRNWGGVGFAPVGTIGFDARGEPTCGGGLACPVGGRAQVTVSKGGDTRVVSIEGLTGYAR